MPPATPLTEPQERSVAQPDRIGIIVLASEVSTVHPGLARFAQDGARAAGRTIRCSQIEPALFAVLDLIEDRTAIGMPRHVDDQKIDCGVLAGVGPCEWTAGRAHDAEPGGGIGIPRLWIVPSLEVGVIREVVDDRKFGNGLFIELEECQCGRIGAPPVTSVIAAAVQLLFVHPIKAAVENLTASVGRQRTLLRSGRVDNKKIAVAHECDEPSIRTERGDFLLPRFSGQPSRLTGAKRIGIEVRIDGQQRTGPVGTEDQCTRSTGPSCLIARHARQLRQGRFHSCGIVQRLRLAAGRVDRDPVHATAVGARPDVTRVSLPVQTPNWPAAECDGARRIVEVREGQ